MISRHRLYLPLIWGAFHNNFPGSSGFGFCRKLARTKNQQGTDKASKHNRCTLFSQALIFCTHQQKWRQLFFILYPIFVLIPHYLRQLPFSPLPPPPPPLEHAAAILDCVSVLPGRTPSSLPPLIISHLRLSPPTIPSFLSPPPPPYLRFRPS